MQPLIRIQNAVTNRAKAAYSKLLWRQFNLRWKLRSGVSIKIHNQAEWVIYNDIFVDSEYDPAIAKALNSQAAETRFKVLDLGANVGFFTLRVLDRLRKENQPPELWATMIEGNPKTFRQLRANLESATANPSEMRFVHGLVGPRDGSASIQNLDFHVMNSVTTTPGRNTVTVPFVDVDTLFADNDIIDLLKCDIEGFELEFLRNYASLLTRVNVAVFEFHHDHYDSVECVDILATAGLKHHQLLQTAESFSLHMFWKDESI